jgi:hypothetical protein
MEWSKNSKAIFRMKPMIFLSVPTDNATDEVPKNPSSLEIGFQGWIIG